MNNLFFTALVIVLIYYFFFYLPTQKNIANRPLKQEKYTQTHSPQLLNQTTQTDELATENKKIKQLEQELNQKRQTIIDTNKSYWKLEADKKEDEKVFEQLLKEFKELNEQLA